MKVADSKLSALIAPNGGNFIIPVYQRNYAWGEEQCDQLLADIREINSTKKQHFLGTITYITHRTAEDARDDFMVIDGQQRITTIMLLLKALQQAPSVRKNDEIQKTISGYLFGVSGDKSKVRLKPIKKDREAFECVMSGHWQQYDGKSSSVIKNFRYFLHETRNFTENMIQQMLYTFDRLQIAVVELDSERDDPQLVFERINATGLHLKGLDLIRNFLMMELEPREQTRIFNEYWVKIEDKFSNEKDSEKIIQNFIKVYLRIYRGKNLKEDEKDIYDKFKDLRDELSERNDNSSVKSEKILQDMLKFARIYKIIIDKNAIWQYENETPKEKRILREKIKHINYIDFGVAYPFLMRLIDDFENSRLDFENFNGILDLLISYFIRRAIRAVPTNALNSVLYSIYKNFDSGDNYNISAEGVARYLGQKSGNEVFPNTVMLKQYFETTPIYKSKKVVSLVLYEIEKSYKDEVPEFESLEIEHFYPQKPTAKWREMIGNEEEIANLEQNFLDTFGNLTLLEKPLNSKVGNKPLAEKVELFEEKSSLGLNDYFKGREKWGVNEIKDRAQRLCERFVEIEIFKDIKDEFRRTPELITLADDWVFLKPNLVKFPNGSDKSVTTVQAATKAIIEYLTENHADELASALRRHSFSFVRFGEVSKDEVGVRDVCFDFEEFKFVCNAGASSLRSAVKKLVQACGLNPSEFEIITI